MIPQQMIPPQKNPQALGKGYRSLSSILFVLFSTFSIFLASAFVDCRVYASKAESHASDTTTKVEAAGTLNKGFDVDVIFLTDVVLLLLVTIVGLAVVRVRNLFNSAMMSGIYSLLMALVWVNMYAMDVAFTEAAVGAGISTILILGALIETGTREKPITRSQKMPAFILVLVTGSALIYGTTDMPSFGDPEAPVQVHLAPQYLKQNVHKFSGSGLQVASEHDRYSRELILAETPNFTEFDEHGHAHNHVPNTVTAVLASYRGYDTMFETTVIFIAGVCLILLLRPEEKTK